MITIHPLRGIGEVRSDGSLAEVLRLALDGIVIRPRPDDVLVVAQKIVSKAEGRWHDLSTVVPGAEAQRLADLTHKDARLVELILAESDAIVRAAPHVLIVRHRCGFVMANAGIDRSNIGVAGDDSVLLLPRDCDASAARLREELSRSLEAAPAIVIADSFGRPWRHGVTSVALGASGLPALIDKRGEVDRDGRVLQVTHIALGDQIATAAALAMGEGNEGVPAALVRGAVWPVGDIPAAALIRPFAEDLFR